MSRVFITRERRGNGFYTCQRTDFYPYGNAIIYGANETHALSPSRHQSFDIGVAAYLCFAVGAGKE